MTAVAQASNRVGTLTALRHANFRLYFAGQLASTSGTWMQNVAQGFLVFSITKSELWLGIVACAAGHFRRLQASLSSGSRAVRSCCTRKPSK